MYVVIGIHISDRMTNASSVQEILTEYGCNIKTRLGLHDASEDSCAPGGLMLLQITGGEDKADEIIHRLSLLKSIKAKKMVF